MSSSGWSSLCRSAVTAGRDMMLLLLVTTVAWVMLIREDG